VYGGTGNGGEKERQKIIRGVRKDTRGKKQTIEVHLQRKKQENLWGTQSRQEKERSKKEGGLGGEAAKEFKDQSG